jgi:hypothetical protein
LAPTFGMEKYMEEKKKQKSEWRYKRKIYSNAENNDIGDIKTEIIERTRSVACQSIR